MQRDRLTGDMPKLVVVDEAWSLLQSELFAGEIESWAREMRKLKAALVLASQSLADFATERAQGHLRPDRQPDLPAARRGHAAADQEPSTRRSGSWTRRSSC